MRTTDLIAINEKNSFHEMMLKIKAEFKRSKMTDDIWLTYFSFKETHDFLPIIWKRIQLDMNMLTEKCNFEGTYHHPDSEEEPTKKEIERYKECSAYETIIKLDIEDWFIHAHILMAKLAVLIKKIFLLTISETDKEKILGIKTRGFNDFRKYFIDGNGTGIDTEFTLIITNFTKWYEKALKNIRDDLIQHEHVSKIWGSSIYQKKSYTEFGYSKFRPYFGIMEKTYIIRDKNLSLFPQLKGENNYFELLNFFEKHMKELSEQDQQFIKDIRKDYGGNFPDVNILYTNMTNLFEQINSYFVRRISNHIH